jgi:hypothetical protein
VSGERADVVAALEARRRTGRRAVLRVTPPFSGRMRARLHVAGREGAYESDPAPLHLHPARLVGAVPPYPEPEGTAEPPATPPPDEAVETVEAWRAAVREAVVDEVTLPGTDHRVAVAVLG